MFLIKILNFIKGYISFTVEGFFVERFLNIAIHRKIYLWDIKHLGSQKARMCISRAGFELLDDIAEKTDVEVKKIKEIGLPFFIQKYRGRTAFFAGAAFFFIFLFAMSFFLWAVEIDYEGDVPLARIEQGLENSGLKIGKPMALVNKQHIENTMMTGFAEFAWVGLNKSGTVARVTIKDRLVAPIIEDETIPCNIIAAKPGIITKIDTRLGQALVIEGMAVSEGELLVAGVIDSAALGVRYLHAMSEIEAETMIQKSATAPLLKEVITRTKNAKSRHFLNAFGLHIPLFFSDNVPFAEFERESVQKQARLGKSIFLPFILHYDKFYEVKKETVAIGEAEAIEIAKTRLAEEIKKDLTAGGQILSENLEQTLSPAGEIVITLTWTCSEKIGKQVEILR